MESDASAECSGHRRRRPPPPTRYERGSVDPTTLVVDEDPAEEPISRIRIGIHGYTTRRRLSFFFRTFTCTYDRTVSVRLSTLSMELWEALARIDSDATYEAAPIVGVVEREEGGRVRGADSGVDDRGGQGGGCLGTRWSAYKRQCRGV